MPIEKLETSATARAVGRTHRDPTWYEVADKLNEVIKAVNTMAELLAYWQDTGVLPRPTNLVD